MLRLRLYVLLLIRGCRMVANVTTRHLSFDGKRIGAICGRVEKNERRVGSGSGVNQKNASIESSRTSLGRRYGSGVRRRVSKLKNLAKLACKAAQTAPLAAQIVARVQGHISVLAQPRTRTRGKPHLL